MNRPRLAAFTAINLLNYLDRYLVAAALPYISQSFMLNKQQGGYLVSAFVIGYVLFSPIFGFLGDRRNRPHLMAFGVLVWSLATMLSGGIALSPLLQSFPLLFCVRVLVGIGEASFGSIAPGYIKDSAPDPARLASQLSIFFAAIPVGSAMGYLVVGVVTRFFEWPVAFLLGGIPGLIGAAYLLSLNDTPNRSVASSVSIVSGVREILAEPAQWFAIGGYALNAFALNGIAAFVSTFGISIGFKGEQINEVFGLILVVTGLLGTIGGGKLAAARAGQSSNPLQSMLNFIAWTAFLGTPLLVLAIAFGAPAPFLVLCFLSELLIFAGTGPVNSVIISLSPNHLVTLTQGFTILVLNLFGALVAPVAVGAVADRWSLAAGMQLCSVALFLSGVVWWAGARRMRAREVSGTIR